MSDAAWTAPVRLHEVQRAPFERRLEPDAAVRERIARQLDLLELKRLEADVRAKPWLDGVEISADWTAEIAQTCGVSLEPFDTTLGGRFTVRAVPADSPAAVAAESEALVDPEGEDPPDVLEDDRIDLAAYVVEYLALEIDPFPRKPGVAFEPPPEERVPSPFAALQALKRDPG